MNSRKSKTKRVSTSDNQVFKSRKFLSLITSSHLVFFSSSRAIPNGWRNNITVVQSVTTSVVTLCTTMARKGIQRKIPRDCHVTDNFCRAKRTHWTQWLSAPFREKSKNCRFTFFHYRNNFFKACNMFIFRLNMRIFIFNNLL